MLNHGKFIIRKENLLEYLGLPLNSHVDVSNDSDNIELYILSDEDNDLLTLKQDNSNVDLRRNVINIYSPCMEIDGYLIYEKPSLLSSSPSEEVAINVAKNSKHKNVTVVKNELIYKKGD